MTWRRLIRHERSTRRSVVLGVMAALLLSLVVIPASHSSAQAVEVGGYDCAIVGPGGICFGGDGQSGPGSGGAASVWNYYCRTPQNGGHARSEFGVYPPARPPGELTPEQLAAPDGFYRVNSSEVLTAFWIDIYKLNPTGTYVQRYADCWDVGNPARNVDPAYEDSLAFYTADEAIWRVAGVPDPAFWLIATTAPIDPIAWRDQVAAQIPPAPPPVSMAPHPSRQAVNVASWIWLESGYAPPQGITISDTRGVAILTVTATPIEMTFDPGTGDTPVTCPIDSPAWTPGASNGCTYTYRIPSTIFGGATFSARVSVRWEYTWTFETPVRVFVQDEPFFTAEPFTVITSTVDELQALEVG
jgi:hypothetical protein